MQIIKYRISHYNYKAWQIERLVEPKENAKNQIPHWQTYKYPGNLLQAVRGLLDLSLGEIVTDDVKTLVAAVEDAERRILANIESMIVERGKS